MATATIQGIGPVQLSRVEYTHPDVARLYNQELAALTEIYERRPSVQQQQQGPGMFTDPRTEFTDADYDDIVTAITNLKTLASGGIQRNVVFGDTESPIGTFYLTTRMANSLDMVIRSLEAAGIVVPATATTAQEKKGAVIRWVDLAGFGVAEVLQSAVSAGLNNRSLQSLIELEYVRVGNEVIFEGLNNLEGALRTTQQLMETLNDLQTIRNLISVKDVPTFESFILENNFSELINKQTSAASGFSAFTDDNFVTRYKEAMSKYIKLVIPTVGGTQSLIGRIFGIRSRLRTQLDDLSRLTPGQGRSTQGTLAFNINELLKNISVIFSTTGPNDSIGLLASKIEDFILINQGEQPVSGPDVVITPIGSLPIPSTKVGSVVYKAQLSETTRDKFKNMDINLQTSINTAITSAQSLNDQQKQEVRRFLFVFEEFYKSASAVLTKISQLIEKLAQGIAR